MEVILVGLQAVQTTHQGAIIAVQASAQIWYDQNQVQAKHVLAERSIFSGVRFLSGLDDILGGHCCNEARNFPLAVDSFNILRCICLLCHDRCGLVIEVFKLEQPGIGREIYRHFLESQAMFETC